MSNPTVRTAVRADVPLILHFIRELAHYERAAHEVVATETTIAASLFDAPSGPAALICEDGAAPIGFAVYFFSYSTWLARPGLYLEDLYVTPSARGAGAGRALLTQLAAIALDNDCGRLEWSVLDWNTSAIAFYESLGARAQSEWTTYRLQGDPLTALGHARSARPGMS